MANPIRFIPHPVDPHLELERRLIDAPRQHAEALLTVFDILQSAHENGTLDAVHGLVFARDKIFGRLAEFARTPEGEKGLLNLLQLGKILSSFDPEILGLLSRATFETSQLQKQEARPPSTLQLLRRAMSADGRRGLSFLTLLLTTVGRSLKR